jgi:hypothetical protein
MRRNADLQIITETIEKLIPGATPAFLSVKVTETFPMAAKPGENTWTGSPAGLAERIFTALYGRPSATTAAVSPLAQAEDAKRARDIDGEIGALMDGERALQSAPWYPVRPGDLVHIAYEAAGVHAAFGETYIVGDAGDGLSSMRLLAHTCPVGAGDGMVGCFAVEAADDPVYEAWFEAGPHRLTIVRDGRVVHNGGAR